ncbi:hypothetical protein Tco_0429148, partial [Tanacetum coccineum]
VDPKHSAYKEEFSSLMAWDLSFKNALSPSHKRFSLWELVVAFSNDGDKEGSLGCGEERAQEYALRVCVSDRGSVAEMAKMFLGVN